MPELAAEMQPQQDTVAGAQHLPKFAEHLLRFLPEKQRESFLGDLEEEYHDLYERSGKRQAQRWYYEQVVSSVGPLLLRAARSYLKKRVAWLGALIRREGA
jgi:hypothetical protein